MEHPVTHDRFVNVSRLGIGNVECGIASMLVGPVVQHGMEFDQIVGELSLEFHDITLMPFPTDEVIPRREDIFYRYDIVVFMSEHKEEKTKSTAAQAPLVLVRAKEAYRTWHDHLNKVNRVDRYTIGTRVDETFLALLELIFRATFAYDKFEKLSIVSQALGKNDILKFFLQIAWEQKAIDHTVYGQLILNLDEVGRMLGGWKKNLQEKTPTNK